MFLIRKFRRFPFIALLGVILFCLGLVYVNDSKTAAVRDKDRKHVLKGSQGIAPWTIQSSSSNPDKSNVVTTSVDHDDDQRIKLAVDNLFKVNDVRIPFSHSF
jgi:uncharacterized membrane protein YdfJ with MMPL/SSD domain